MRRSLTKDCIHAIGRVWSWYLVCPKVNRGAYATSLEEMIIFAREHSTEVLLGYYPTLTKVLCIVGRYRNPLVWAALFSANSIRRLLRGNRVYGQP